MFKLLSIFGFRAKTKKNKDVLVRKRLFHDGYQISGIEKCTGSFENEEIFTLITEVETFELFQKWLIEN